MQTTKAANLWCFNSAKNNDKVYGLFMFNQNGKFDVFAVYGRRGSELKTHVHEEGVSQAEAQFAFDDLLASKARKGYKHVAENVMTLGAATPTLVN